MSRLSVDSRALIDAARDGDEPTAADRARVRSALARKIAMGAAAGAVAATATHAATGATAATTATTSAVGAATTVGAGTVAASTVTVTATATIASSLGAKLLVSVAIVSAVGAGTATYAHHEATKRAAEAPSVVMVAPAATASSMKPAPVAIDDLSANANGTGQSPRERTESSDVHEDGRRPPAVNANAIPNTVTSALDAELALLQDAHTALRSNDGARALRLLGEHARRFPNGQLREESEAARVFALCELGRVDEARDVAGRFLREHPTSPLAPRVSRACDSADPPSTF